MTGSPANGFKGGVWSPGLCCARRVSFSSLGVLPAVCMKVGSDPEEQNGCQSPSPMMLPPHSILITTSSPLSSGPLALGRCPLHSYRVPSSFSFEKSSLSRCKQKSQPGDQDVEGPSSLSLTLSVLPQDLHCAHFSSIHLCWLSNTQSAHAFCGQMLFLYSINHSKNLISCSGSQSSE